MDGRYANSGNAGYIKHRHFANAPQQYIRAFMLVQKDLLELFDYVEPSDKNLDCYSYRIHELHTRTCIEVEANCKAILSENAYTKAGNWTMDDYKKLSSTHRLSSYEVKLPLWHGNKDVHTPFSSWATGGVLGWYQAYNQAKHDRHQQFEQANFGNLLDAVAALVALLGAQFYTEDFAPHDFLVLEGPNDGWDVAIGSYFLIKFPSDWPTDERYNFDWKNLQNEVDPFQTLTF